MTDFDAYTNAIPPDRRQCRENQLSYQLKLLEAQFQNTFMSNNLLASTSCLSWSRDKAI